MIRARPDIVGRAGIGFCPEERGIFAGLTVQENLLLPPVVAPGGMSIADIHALFPNLKERAKSPGTKLSGGEQQMLAIARILRTGAKLLLLDEPTEGLAPVIVQQIGLMIAEIKRRGFTVLLVEQNFRFAAKLADRHYVVEHGQVVDMIPAHLLEDTHGGAAATPGDLITTKPTKTIILRRQQRMKITRRSVLGTAARRRRRGHAAQPAGARREQKAHHRRVQRFLRRL